MGLPDTYEELLINYSRMNSDSFDYAIVEKEKAIAAVRYEGQWRDLGTWRSLTKQMKDMVIGPGFVSEDCNNVHLLNSTDIPIIALGLSDIVISASRDGILVSHKSASPMLKDALKQLENGSSASSNRDAWSRTLDDVVFADGTSVTTSRIHLNRGMLLNYSGSEGKKRTVSWTILNGKSRLYKNGAAIETFPGCTVTFEADDVGEINALDPLDMIECSTTSC
jgi:mannose-1-phosphate guanylyltransferase